ncbi:hypothetical protein [Luteibacter sp. 329MFSha]|uniref:hypothetical protein n=1 Tax=Luteibacter sp. 329MFSha TaxID=1798239 RepID=UPI0008B42D6F|nr:hypothetical protein [Luteibacter sp. 329MFSha]SEW03961.1 hypothetical protein SAMN04515660_2014 [Luteibacter sp. 329MFSha]
MGKYSDTFDWIDLPQGRVRYAGGKRGRDEPPIETFAAEIFGSIYYGEVRAVFLADGNNFNVEIVSFGWLKHDWFGTDPDPRYCAAFTLRELGEVQSLLGQMISAWCLLDERPFVIDESAQSRFMGDILFRNGWVLVRDDEDRD